MDVEQTATSQSTLVTFRLDGQTYALPIEPIVQIIEMVTITPIPQVNHAIEGVINVRGQTVPVVNLRFHLGLPKASLQLRTPIILTQRNGSLEAHRREPGSALMLGLIVDQVMDVLSVPTRQITRPTDILPDGLGDAPLLHGLVRLPDGMALVLSFEQLFRAHSPRALADALAGLSEGAPPEAAPPENGKVEAALLQAVAA